MKYLQVKNFEAFQHYRNRAPIWIKLYRSLLTDYEFASLPDATKAHLILIWLIASETENRVPADPDWIARRIGAQESVNLDLLVRLGFLEETTSNPATAYDQPYQKDTQKSASKSLARFADRASVKQSRDREQKKREEQQQTPPAAVPEKYEDEAHQSIFTFKEIQSYVEATKPHALNPGGLARLLFRTGEEDEQIGTWINERNQKPANATEPEPDPAEFLRIAEDFEASYPDPLNRPEWVQKLLAEAEAIRNAA